VLLVRQDGRPDNTAASHRACHPDGRPSGMSNFQPASRPAIMPACNSKVAYDNAWENKDCRTWQLSGAYGSAAIDGPSLGRALFCTRALTIWCCGVPDGRAAPGDGQRAVITARQNPSAGRIFLSPERSKLCFELLRTFCAAQNHLSCRGLKTPSEVGVFLK